MQGTDIFVCRIFLISYYIYGAVPLFMKLYIILGVNNELREKLEGIIFGSWSTYEDDFKQNLGNTKIAYGVVNFGQTDDHSHYACLYAFYTAEMKFTEELTIKDHPILWGLINIKTWEKESVPLPPETVEAIHDFFRYKALDGFLKVGFIHKINFVD